MQTEETIIAAAPTLRKYFYESVVIVLASCVVCLFLMYNDLSKFVRTEMTKQIVEQTRVIERNTDALNVLIIHGNKTN